MSDTKKSAELAREAQMFTCEHCGRNYIVRKSEVQYSSTGKFRSYCRLCQKEMHDQKEQEKQQQENLEWEKKKAEDQKAFDKLLSNWNVKVLSEIHPPKETLYIIGNGFDLMHGVKSSYYSFRDSIGKHGNLRYLLETFWTPQDIWADLENGLAEFNMNGMGSRSLVDMWLDNCDAYDDDASAASFCMATEIAATPMTEVSRELPRRFRQWIQTLTVGTNERPLNNLFAGGKVLDFNYTEFVQTLYGVPTKDVCYIHGCRCNNGEKLVLGHRPGASDQSYELAENHKQRKKTYRNGLIQVAQDAVIDIVSACDYEITKDSGLIIKNHASFFDSIKNVRNIVIIGHSMSQVDWDYFHEVASRLEDKHNVIWWIGVNGLNDLNNMKKLVEFLEVQNIIVFRTDTIHVKFVSAPTKPVTQQKISEFVLCESEDKRWQAKKCNMTFKIVDSVKNRVSYEVLLSSDTRKAFFDESGKYLFVIIRGVYSGVLLFSLREGRWMLINELEGIQNQGVLNRRLRKVYLKDTHITFVYNSRVRRYDLENGHLVNNLAVRSAPIKDYTKEGKDVSQQFMR